MNNRLGKQLPDELIEIEDFDDDFDEDFEPEFAEELEDPDDSFLFEE